MTIIHATINKAGEEMALIHSRYHSENDPFFKKILEESFVKNLPANASGLKAAFQSADNDAFKQELAKYKRFKADTKTYFDEIAAVANEYLKEQIGDTYSLFLLPSDTNPCLCFEKRIGLKASKITEVTGVSPEKAQAFFTDGHADALIDTIIIPELEKFVVPKLLPENVSVTVSAMDTPVAERKYMRRASIVVKIPLNQIIEPERDLEFVVKISKSAYYFAKHHLIYF